MLIGCVVPILLIFPLLALGVSNNVTFVVFVLLMFACHFFMLGHHRGGTTIDNQNMNSISPRRLGLAFGLTCVAFYLACILTMISAPYDKQIVFFKSLSTALMFRPFFARAYRLAKCCRESFPPSFLRGLLGP